jgi:hypothetical protein
MVVSAFNISRNCYSHEDGYKLFLAIVKALRDHEQLTISFEGVDSISSSFVNASLIPLLDLMSFEEVKNRLAFVKTTPQINELIKSRFSYESQQRK